MNKYTKLKLALFQLQEFIKRETKDNKTCYLTEKDIEDLVGFETRVGGDITAILFQRVRYSDEFHVEFIERYTSGSGIMCPDQLRIKRIKESENPKPVTQSENSITPESNKNDKKVKIKLNGFFEDRKYEYHELSNDLILKDYKAFDFKDYMCEVDESSIRNTDSSNYCTYLWLRLIGKREYSSIEILPDDTEIDPSKCPFDYLVSLPYPLRTINT